jgi:hypothetical protein
LLQKITVTLSGGLLMLLVVAVGFFGYDWMLAAAAHEGALGKT